MENSFFNTKKLSLNIPEGLLLGQNDTEKITEILINSLAERLTDDEVISIEIQDEIEERVKNTILTLDIKTDFCKIHSYCMQLALICRDDDTLDYKKVLNCVVNACYGKQALSVSQRNNLAKCLVAKKNILKSILQKVLHDPEVSNNFNKASEILTIIEKEYM